MTLDSRLPSPRKWSLTNAQRLMTRALIGNAKRQMVTFALYQGLIFRLLQLKSRIALGGFALK